MMALQTCSKVALTLSLASQILVGMGKNTSLPHNGTYELDHILSSFLPTCVCSLLEPSEPLDTSIHSYPQQMCT